MSDNNNIFFSLVIIIISILIKYISFLNESSCENEFCKICKLLKKIVIEQKNQSFHIKSNNKYEAIISKPVYAIINCISDCIDSNFVLCIVKPVESIPILIIGKRIGNDKIGNSAFFDDAFEIIAEITVVADAIAIEHIIIMIINNPIETICAVFTNKKKKTIEKKFMNKLNNILYINFPKNIELALTVIPKSNEVPRSSSFIKDFDSPIIVPKNMTIQSKLEVAS